MNTPDILYEDNHIVVAVKPQNMPSQADSSRDPDFLSQVKAYIKEEYNKPGEAYIGLVHRLDRPAGGVMVFARTSKAAQRLAVQMRGREFKKTYLAVVTKPLPQPSGRLADFLVKDTESNMSRVVPEDFPGAKYAELTYETLSSKEGFYLLKIDLLTGRPHQIRVQLAHASSPILGDKRYDGALAQNMCLWSYKLEFDHPTSKERLRFTCPPPDAWPWNLFALVIER